MVGVSLDVKDDNIIESNEGPLRVTQQEIEALQNYKKTENKFWMGLLTGVGLTWAASSKLHTYLGIDPSTGFGKLYKTFRFSLIWGAGKCLGRWCYERAIVSSVDHMLSLRGTWLQRELAASLAADYQIQKNPLMIPIFSKHFYSEEVYDDSSLLPKLRFHLRNSSSHQGLVDDSQGDSLNANFSDSHVNFDHEKADFQSKQIPVNSASELMMDPLDCVFGYMATTEEIDQSSTSSESSEA